MPRTKKFIDRKYELAGLDEIYREKSSQLAVIYGRRRVGKSTLITEFCKGKSHFFFTGRKKERQGKLQDRLLKNLADFFGNPLISKVKATDWQDIFEIIDGERENKKLIIIFDEFQWMCPKRSTLISALQDHWDKKWKDDGRIFLVICGSIISFMEREVLSEKSPLFGRRTFSMELEAMTASAGKQFFPSRNPLQQGEIIMTLGGIPSYLELIKAEHSLAQNINRMALSKSGYLVDEIQFVLGEQLKNPQRYYLLLEKLAGQPLSREELAKAMNMQNSGVLALYLKTLLNLHLIKRYFPITKEMTSKTQRYKLWDEYLRFYFRFIMPNKERINTNDDNEWLFDKLITPYWGAYCGYSFELFCEKNIKAIISILGIKEVFKGFGAYWQTKTARREGLQIDMVIERADNVTHLVECKWSQGKVGKSAIEELARKKRLYPNPHNHTLKITLIVAAGVTKEVAGSSLVDNVITLKDILDHFR